MTPRTRFDPEAADELEEAVIWYDGQRSGLGRELREATERTIARIERWPDTGTPIAGVASDLAVRSAAVPRFPYQIAYLLLPDQVRVLAFAHDNRQPGYWHDRAE